MKMIKKVMKFMYVSYIMERRRRVRLAYLKLQGMQGELEGSH